MDEETIVALATPPGRAGIAVIRISGSQSEAIARKIVQPLPAKLQARRSYHGFIHDGARRIDECLAVLFRAPRSYSGEDMAEISLHSNLFVIEEVLALICRLRRPAGPARRIHLPRLPQRQAGPAAGRGGQRPDPGQFPAPAP